MNRPIGFDLADLTATEAKAVRNGPQPASYVHQIAAYSAGVQSTKRRRQQRTRRALIDAVKVAGGALACIFVVTWLAVWMAY